MTSAPWNMVALVLGRLLQLEPGQRGGVVDELATTLAQCIGKGLSAECEREMGVHRDVYAMELQKALVAVLHGEESPLQAAQGLERRLRRHRLRYAEED